MKLIIVSGLSGAGKSVVLHTLEDEGFYCIDNLPAQFINTLLEQITRNDLNLGDKIAMSMDIRSLGKIQNNKPTFDIGAVLARLRDHAVDAHVIFVEANQAILLRRYGELRRPHPLAHQADTLEQAITLERRHLDDVLRHASLKIDTSNLNLHQLRQLIRSRVCEESKKPSVLIQSFGYKKGMPLDSDFVFDIRCLLNPYWKPELRELTGLDTPVVEFLESDDTCNALFEQLYGFIKTWLGRFEREPRSRLTLSIGCTGGQHRSVYMVERLYAALAHQSGHHLSKYHRELL